MEYVHLTICWISYYLFHSYGASDQLKIFLRSVNFNLNSWRVIYSILSVAGLLAILLLMATMKDQVLWPQNRMIKLISMILITYGLIVVRLAFKKYSVREFLSSEDRFVEHPELNVSGIYSKVRHPIYSGTILLFIGMFLFIAKLGTLVALIVTLIYLLIAIPMEEQKLVRKHGEAYLKYKKQVPAILPRLWGSS